MGIIIMYSKLNCFEEALKHFSTRVDVICAMELSKKLSSEDAYQMIKDELREVKKCRRTHKKDSDSLEEKSEHYWQPDRNKTYDQMIADGWNMTDDGFWIKE